MSNIESNEYELNSIKKVKKSWQTPTITLISSGYVEGGAGANVHENTAKTVISGNNPGQGFPGVHVYHAGPPFNIGVQSANWTAAHS